MKKESVNFDLRRLSLAVSPILIFILLIPFMQSQVPYHTDLFGNVDGTGSKWVLFGIVSIFALVIYYTYGKKDEKKIVYPIVVLILSILNILLLSGAVVESDNLFAGFYMNLNASYGNLITFLLFCVSLVMFLFVEKIPPNSLLGIKNSVTSKSEIAWKMVHNRSKMQFWINASINLFLFYIPSISAVVKLSLSFFVMMICLINVILISRTVSRELKKLSS